MEVPLLVLQRMSTITLQISVRTLAWKAKPNAAHLRHIEEKLMFGGLLESKREKKIRIKKQKKEGKPLESVGASAPDSEQFWLSNIGAKDIKVYRKTTTGRYKEVDKDKVLKALRDEEEAKNLAGIVNVSKEISFPQIILRNMTTMPMLGEDKTREVSTLVDPKNLPSVTKILSTTMSEQSKAALERWKQNLILELGEDGFEAYHKQQLDMGVRFHATIRRYLEGFEPLMEPTFQLIWNSVQSVVKNISNVKMLETHVTHPKLLYKGVVDCVASYKDVPSVIEWKLSGKERTGLSATYDAPLQLSAYLGALSYLPQFPDKIRNGIVVVAYKDGRPADVFLMDEKLCQRHWSLWLQRLQLYWQTTKTVL